MDRPRLLAVFAHPDDETFLAGGTLAKYGAAGWQVLLVCASRGEAGKRGPYEGRVIDFGQVRIAELNAACAALGIGPPRLLDCADGAGGACGGRGKAAVAEVLATFGPDVVITFGPDGISGHEDHVAVHQFVTASFHEWRSGLYAPAGARTARLYYVLRSAAVPACCKPRGPEPRLLTTVIDIATVGDRKLAAVRCHKSQSHLQPTDSETAHRIAESPEHFHRAWPVWPDPTSAIETTIGAPAALIALRRHGDLESRR